MKTIKIICISLILNSSFLILNSQAASGDEYYRQGNYQAALQVYDSILASGQVSADLYYNLGNTYYRLDRFADAILCYERALRLKPSMSDARENLELANSKTQDRITTLPRLFLVNWYSALITRLSPSLWRTIFLVLFALLATSLVVFLLARRLSLRKGSFIAFILSALLTLAALFFMLKSTAHFNARSAAIVMQPSVAVKSSPEHQSVDKMILHEGTRVEITESLSEWNRITLADGTTGWLPAQTIERI